MKRQQILERVLRPISYDLNMMLRIPVIPNANGNCAAPLALYSMAAMGFLGYLTAPNELEENEPIERILAFSEPYCDLDMRITAKILYGGLVHRLVPKGMGLGRYGYDADLFVDYNGFTVLNADKLAYIVLTGVLQLEGQLIEDDELADRIWDRIMALSHEEGDE